MKTAIYQIIGVVIGGVASVAYGVDSDQVIFGVVGMITGYFLCYIFNRQE